MFVPGPDAVVRKLRVHTKIARIWGFSLGRIVLRLTRKLKLSTVPSNYYVK